MASKSMDSKMFHSPSSGSFLIANRATSDNASLVTTKSASFKATYGTALRERSSARSDLFQLTFGRLCGGNNGNRPQIGINPYLTKSDGRRDMTSSKAWSAL